MPRQEELGVAVLAAKSVGVPTMSNRSREIACQSARWPAAISLVVMPEYYGEFEVHATVLLADHQTTGGYPKIATVVSDQVGSLVQHRSGSQISFRRFEPQAAIQELRARREHLATFLASLRAKPMTLLHRLMSVNLIDGVTSGAPEA